MALWATNVLIKCAPQIVAIAFILADLAVAYCLYEAAKRLTILQLEKQRSESTLYAKDTDDFLLKEDAIQNVPRLALVAYLFNPYSILNCVGQTMTVWSNLLLAIYLVCMVRRWTMPAIVALVLEVQQNLYPIVLIVPLVCFLSTDEKSKSLRISKIVQVLTQFVVVALVCTYINCRITKGSWEFLDATYGFM